MSTIQHDMNKAKITDDNVKYLFFVHYSGHGFMEGFTTQIFLPSGELYPLESRLQILRNTCRFAFVVGVFDCCRVVKPESMTKGSV